MIDFLLINGIKLETIKEISKNSANVFDLESNKDECIKIITFFRFIGIKNIDDILLNNLGIFFKTKDEIVKRFSKYNVETLVEKINLDPNNIDVIFE